MAQAIPVVTKEADFWVIRQATASGKTQEYRCASEEKARALAALLTTPPAPPAQAAAGG